MTVLSNCQQNSLPSFNKEKEYSNFIESYNTKKLETKEDFDDYFAYRKNPDQKWFLWSENRSNIKQKRKPASSCWWNMEILSRAGVEKKHSENAHQNDLKLSTITLAIN